MQYFYTSSYVYALIFVYNNVIKKKFQDKDKQIKFQVCFNDRVKIVKFLLLSVVLVTILQNEPKDNLLVCYFKPVTVHQIHQKFSIYI